MSNQNKEIERLQRLRDRQLQARDPLKKERKKQGHITRQFKSRKGYTFGTASNDIGYKVKGALIGIFVAVLLWIILSIFIKESWVDLVGLFAVISFPLIGFILGSSFDWRDKLRDL